jgi:hypothetical protein
MTADDILLVNCADCRCDLLGESQDLVAAVAVFGDDCPRQVADRIDGRPYCYRCMRFLQRERERAELRKKRTA